MIKSDFHLHTKLSSDGISEMADMIETAVDRGLENICFTEHMDYDNPFDNEDGDFEVDTDAYYKRYKELTADETRISVGFGIELGLQPHLVEYYNEYLAKYPFDFVIGSSHAVYGQDPWDKRYYEAFESEDAAYRTYFEGELECAELFDNYDIYGHLDYALRYGPNGDKYFSYEKYADVLDEILKNIIAKGKGIEINSSGYRKGMKGANPADSIIRRYRELGGEIITVGSDAHVTTDVAADFDRAEKALLDCGFRYYTIFRNRKPQQLPL